MSNKMIQNDSQNSNLNLIESAQLERANHKMSFEAGFSVKNSEKFEII
jgi:hypothetical protein